MKRAFLILLSVLTAVSSLIEREWVSAEVGDPAGLETTSVRKEVYFTSSLRHCMGLATRNDWAYLACYLPSEGCSLFESNAIVDGEVKRNETLGLTECKVRRDLTICHEPIGVFGGKRMGQCLGDFICTANGWEESGPDTPATTCNTTNGFSMIAGMCLLISSSSRYYCGARSTCQYYGGDIASFETTELFDNLRPHLTGANSLFVGLVKTSGNWAWKFNKRSPGEPNTGDWGNYDIDTPDECSLMQHSAGFKMRPYTCTANQRYICRIYI